MLIGLHSAATLLALTLASLGASLVLAGGGARQEQAVGEPDMGASGFIVFSGLGSGSYMHAIRSDGAGLRPVQLPESCSPKDFTRDGGVLICDETSDPWKQFAVERRDGEWRRVPGVRFPRRANFPAWVRSLAFDAPEWAPVRDRIALIRSSDSSSGYWFSTAGDVVVVDADGAHERVVASDGQAPTWSPDGTRLAFARCRVTGRYTDDESADCSIWTTSADGAKPPELLAQKAVSPPVWSPNGRFIAFFRETGPCAIVCKQRIFVVPAEGGNPRPVGPELTEPRELFWLPSSASGIQASVGADASAAADPLDLQRCADIWNRVRMRSPTAVANVSIVNDRCQVTTPMGYRDAGFVCWQSVPWSLQCPSHGGNFSYIDPDYRVWNAQVDKGGRLTLLEPPKGPRLALPKPPPYPMLDGYVLPFRGDGQPRLGLTFTETVGGTCTGGGYVDHPDSVRCGWKGKRFSYIHNECFKPPGRVAVGDIVLCPKGAGSTSFLRVRLSEALKP